MFVFITQIYDLIHLHQVGLFLVFFVTVWTIHLIKRWKAKQYIHRSYPEKVVFPSVDIVIPVANEDINVWKRVLGDVKQLQVDYNRPNLKLIKNVFVIPNGSNAIEEEKIAKEKGFKVYRVEDAGKRGALLEASKYTTSDITIILDSDTRVEKLDLLMFIAPFVDNTIGGVMPTHKIYERDQNIWRVVSDWLEDIRFNEVAIGQTQDGAVSCLAGRALAVRTHLFKDCVDDMNRQTFMGNKCISGDDRFLTSWLLKRDWKCIYEPFTKVETDAPNTLDGFVKQRLRWSRTSFRETLLSLEWISKYPFMAFTVISNVVTRWLFFIVLVVFLLQIAGIIERNHYLQFSTFQLVLFTFMGFIVSGFLKQLRHIRKYPSDIVYLIPFLFITTFILTPVEWFGNLTLKESGWMTRKVD